VITALAIINTSGIVSVVVGAVLSSLPILIAGLFVLGVYRVAAGRWNLEVSTRNNVALGLAAAAVVLLTPWPVVILGWLTFLVGLASRRLKFQIGLVLVAGGLLMVVEVVTAIVGDTPWPIRVDQWAATLRQQTFADTLPGVPFLAVAAVVLMLVAEACWWIVRPHWRRLSIRALQVLLVLLALAPLGFVAKDALFVMWVPREALQLNDERRPLIGYVLEDKEGWMSVLKTQERKLVRIDSDWVVYRSLCRKNYHESIWQLSNRRILGNDTRVPTCSDTED
jgi:hypothetical protein